MSSIQPISDPNYVSNQYQNASNLNTRIRLHHEFSMNKYGWYRWLFDRFQFPPQGRILELGCGGGNLWLENLDCIPNDLEIILSDLSPGMLEQAHKNLSGSTAQFRFEIIDAQSIPSEKENFDVVIASHMLYHVPDQAKALSEIRRVLKPSGYFYASTFGQNDLRELGELVSRFDPGLSSWRQALADSFTLENGPPRLSQYFSSVALYRYLDSLEITQAGLLVDYLLSGRIELPAERQEALRQFVEAELDANGGTLNITKDAGVFEAGFEADTRKEALPYERL